MGDFNFCQGLNVGTDSHAVGGDTEQGLRMIFSYCPHGGDGFRAIGKGITWTGDAGNAYPWFFFKYPLHIHTSLFRGEDSAGDSGSRLVDTVIFTITKIAFNIAFWRDGQMNSAKFSFGVSIKAGMSFENLLLLNFS